jgi:D-sedoheptulose 7-phosphate isomerase
MVSILEDRISYVKEHLQQSANLKIKTAIDCAEAVNAASIIIADAFKAGNKLLLVGNGGSAADCQHMASEFMGRMSKVLSRRALPAIALTTDTSFITAHSNDATFSDIFSRQIEGLGKAGDVLFAISTSGASENVVWAVRRAQSLKMKVVTLTGVGGKINKEATVAIKVPSKNTQYIQEAHLAIEHTICELVESILFG